jgi:hypothetical protein
MDILEEYKPMKTCFALVLGFLQTLTAQTNPSVVGSGWGLDHVIIALPNPSAVKDVFGTKLGFTPFGGNKFPGLGLEQALIRLPPAYVELLWPYQKPTDARNSDPVVKMAETGGGPVSYNIDVSPVDQAADAMRRFGLRVTLPPSKTLRTPDGKEVPGNWQFINIDPQDQAAAIVGVPGGAGVGFLEYGNNSDFLKPDRFQRARERAEREFPDPRRSAGEIHANTARKLRSVWVTVPSLAEAVAQAQRFGLRALDQRYFKALGEKGLEVTCGQGTIVFFEPIKRNSTVAALVKKQGLGPFGISVSVTDLKTAQRVVQAGTHARLGIQRIGNEMSFLVPAELAGGTFVEFVQQ